MYYRLVFLALLLFANLSCAEELVSALKKAYQKNPKILAEREKYAAQKSLQEQIFSTFLPDVRISYTQGSTEINKISNEFKNMQISMEQPLFKGGETISQYQASKEALNAEKGQLALKEEELLFEAISAYLEVIKNQKIYELSEFNSNIIRQYKERAQAKYELGDATKTDVAFAQSRLSAAISEKLKAEALLITSKANYQHIFVEAPENLSMPQNTPELPVTLEEVIEVASRNNSNLNIANARKKAAILNVHSINSKILPNINATFATTFSNASSMDKKTIAFNVNFPMFNRGGIEIWKISEAKHNASRARYEYIETAHAIKKAATTTWQSIEAAKSTIKSSQDAINFAQIAFSATQQEYDLGLKTMLDTLDAQKELFLAKVNLIKSKHDYNILIYRLILLMGMLNLNNIS